MQRREGCRMCASQVFQFWPQCHCQQQTKTAFVTPWGSDRIYHSQRFLVWPANNKYSPSPVHITQCSRKSWRYIIWAEEHFANGIPTQLQWFTHPLHICGKNKGNNTCRNAPTSPGVVYFIFISPIQQSLSIMEAQYVNTLKVYFQE